MQLFVGKAAQILHIRQGAARMSGNKIICQKLLVRRVFIEPVKKHPKLLQLFDTRFSHQRQDLRIMMLRRDLHLTGDMITADLIQVMGTRAGIRKDHVITDAGCGHKLLDAGDPPGTLQQARQFFMIDPQRRTGLREKTAFILAAAVFLLFQALKPVHICRRTAHIGDDPAETGERCNVLDFFKDRIFRPPLDCPSFMNRDRAEVALPVTAAMGRHGKADRLQRFDCPLFLVIRMDVPFVRQGINSIQLGL